MNNPVIPILIVWAAVVILIIVVSQKLAKKRREAAKEKRIQSVKEQIQYVQEKYIMEPSVKYAFAYSNSSMCRTASEKAKEAAKNVAKAVVRTTLTGRASYRGSDINGRNYLIGYGNQTYYFFHVLNSDTAKELNFVEEEFFSIEKDDIKNIIVKDKQAFVIYMDMNDDSRVGFRMKNIILSEVDFTAENGLFKDYILNEAALLVNR